MLSEMKSSNYCQSLLTACLLSSITFTVQLSVFQNAAKLHLKTEPQNVQNDHRLELSECGNSAHVDVVFHVSCM